MNPSATKKINEEKSFSAEEKTIKALTKMTNILKDMV